MRTSVKSAKTAKASRKKESTRKARSTTKGTTKAAADVRPGSKLEKIAKLLRRPQGCTAADVLKVTGWPSVSMPQQAKAAGLTLKTEKEGRTTRYRAA